MSTEPPEVKIERLTHKLRSSKLTRNQRLKKNEMRIIMNTMTWGPYMRIVYIAIRSFRNSVSGWCYPKRVQICNKGSVDMRTITKYRSLLIKDGWIRYNKGIQGKEKKLYEFPLLDGPDEEIARLYTLSGVKLTGVYLHPFFSPNKGDLTKEKKKEEAPAFFPVEKRQEKQEEPWESLRENQKKRILLYAEEICLSDTHNPKAWEGFNQEEKDRFIKAARRSLNL